MVGGSGAWGVGGWVVGGGGEKARRSKSPRLASGEARLGEVGFWGPGGLRRSDRLRPPPRRGEAIRPPAGPDFKYFPYSIDFDHFSPKILSSVDLCVFCIQKRF